MTDKPQFDPARFEEGVELVFDEIDDAPPAEPRKRVRTGRKTGGIEAFPFEEASEPAAPAAEAVPVSEATPDAAPADAPAAAPVAHAAPDAAPAKLILVALFLSLFTSIVACVGLLMASRTIAAADAAARAADAQKGAFAQLPATLDRLNHVIAGEQAALATLAQGRAAQPVTLTDLQKELDGLRTAIAAQQPQQNQQLVDLTKSGQSEIVERLAAIQDALDHMNAKAPRPGDQ